MAEYLPIDLRIVEQLAKATIKNIIDGIVELITNSDDSYKRIEERDGNCDGKILIYIDRQKGGACSKLIVQDFAEGMTNKELKKAIVFGGETSGFSQGRNVRGLFGRGLKETIIALGEGEIKAIENGKIAKTKLWLDKNERKPLYDDEMLNKSEDTSESNGTTIEIKVMNENIKIPEFNIFKSQLVNHYALRDINSSENRELILVFDDIKRSLKTTVPIKFIYPEGKKVIEKEINLPGFGDKIVIKIYESSNSLTCPRNNPYGLAGILIKTKCAILDNRLFRFENEPVGCYFFGEALCEGIEDRLRKGETGIIDPNRGGLEWRHEYCQALSDSIEMILEPLINEKKKILEKRPEKEITESTKKMIRNLCSLLNRIAKAELEDIPEVPVDPGPEIEALLIKPEVANIEEGNMRTFSIYAPTNLIECEGREAQIKYNNWAIRPLSSRVNLEKHPKFPDKLWYRYFKVVGEKRGEEGNIIVNLGKEKAIAKVKVAPFRKKKRGKFSGRKGGFISDIYPDELPDPPQRAVYKDGIIKVYVSFPSVTKFISSGLEGVESPQGRLMLAELVGDAFCRALATKGVEFGKFPKIPGGEIDSFNSALNELQKKYLHKIQEIIFAWKF